MKKPEIIKQSEINFFSKSVTYLIGINALLFLVTVYLLSLYNYNIFEDFALFHPRSESFQIVQFFSHLFLHGGFFHLLMNMFVLWMFGTVLESVWGWKKFTFYYLFTGLGAAALHLLFATMSLNSLETATQDYIDSPSFQNFIEYNEEHVTILPQDMAMQLHALVSYWQIAPQNDELISQSQIWVAEYYEFRQNIPSVGASGAVFGVLLAFGLLFPNTAIFMFFLFPIKAKYFVIFIGLLELYTGLFDEGNMVANFAHLGGMLFGLGLILLWNPRQRIIRTKREEKIMDEMEQKMEAQRKFEEDEDWQRRQDEIIMEHQAGYYLTTNAGNEKEIKHHEFMAFSKKHEFKYSEEDLNEFRLIHPGLEDVVREEQEHPDDLIFGKKEEQDFKFDKSGFRKFSLKNTENKHDRLENGNGNGDPEEKSKKSDDEENQENTGEDKFLKR